MSRLRLSVIVAIALALAPLPRPGSAQQQIESGIFSLQGIDDSLPHDDLRPLGEILDGAQLIGLGESVHTTEGFSRAKLRLFKYLVEEEGVRVFGFESPWIAAERVARYVESCRGTAANAITGLFGVWQSTSVRDLVKWMCRYNRKHKDDPLHFYGFDIQYQGRENVEALRQLMLDAGVKPRNPKITDLDACFQAQFTTSSFILEEDYVACSSVIERIEKFFDRRRRRIVRRTSPEALAWGRIHLAGLRAWETEVFFFHTSRARSFNGRDEGMAYVAAAIREIRFPQARTAIWAHNAHISKSQYFVGETPMGVLLDERFGDAYQTVGLVANSADLDWPRAGFCGLYKTATGRSVEGRLHSLGEPFLLVDLDFPGTDEPLLEPGVTYEMNWDTTQIPADNYDALLYMEHASRMIPVGRPPCSSS